MNDPNEIRILHVACDPDSPEVEEDTYPEEDQDMEDYYDKKYGGDS